MKSFILGVIFGGAMSSVGFSSIAPILDNGMRTIQQTSINLVRNQQGNITPQVYPDPLPLPSSQSGTQFSRSAL
jgi:hypothetical protein